MIASMPVSTKGAIATGPAMVMRYSRFVHTLRSPPGNTIWSTGIGTVQLPSRGLAGFLGTGVPSGLVSVITLELGRNATGEIDCITKPGLSFPPQKKKGGRGGPTGPAYPLRREPLMV